MWILDKNARAGLLQTLHDHQYRHAFTSPVYIHPGGEACTLLQIVTAAIKKWAADKEDEAEQCIIQKLSFAYSDILRDASARMRMAQALETPNKLVHTSPTRATRRLQYNKRPSTGILLFTKNTKKNTPPTSHAQVQISPLEMMSAVRNWLRTMEIFMGYLRHLEQVQERTPQERKPKDAQRFSLQNATNPPATEELSIDKALRQELMKIAQGTQPLNMAEAREKVKLKAKFRKIPDLSKTLQSAKSSLTDLGLLLDVERPTSQNSKKKTTSGWVRIARWNQLSNRAKTEAKSLTRQKSTTTNRQRPSLPSAFSCTRPFERILRGL